MIATLEGALAEVLLDGAVVDVGGVGYRLRMPASSIARLPARGRRVRLHTSLQVREDSMTLYGFTTPEERDCFEILLGVAGVGPKGALAVLGAHAPSALRRAVVSEDVASLTLIPGVGKKTAARMILELREKLGVDPDGIPGAPHAHGAALAEVRGALEALGYSAPEIAGALALLAEANGDLEGARVQDLVKRALQTLARR